MSTPRPAIDALIAFGKVQEAVKQEKDRELIAALMADFKEKVDAMYAARDKDSDV